jgi:hypothetical protein
MLPLVSRILNLGEPGGTRTRDHRIKSAMLYQLSYRPWSWYKVGVPLKITQPL